MSERKAYFRNIDDDYLIGLSNKGIVKRAYKDLESARLAASETEEAIVVTEADITCKLLMPLGESRCSCPSRSICKHIVMAAIYIKQWYEEQVSGIEGESEQSEIQTEQLVPEEVDLEETFTLTRNFKELDSMDLIKLQKQLGVVAFRKLYQRMMVTEAPSVEITSVVTVFFPDTNMTVKLLEPLAYSTCSCHKKELCSHKAEAILSYQMHQGILTKEQLQVFYEELGQMEYDKEAIADLIEQMTKLLGEIIFNGLARISPEVTTSCERMALMCHNEQLARFENEFRKLGDMLDLYHRRYASVSVKGIMQQVVFLYQLTNELKRVLSTGDIASVAGKMRSEYVLTQPLNLMAMGQRHFVSQTGYEGDTIYFIEEESGKWYTYTDARPVFYDSSKKSRKIEQYSTAPWNLNCTKDDLANVRIRLIHGKVNDDNRLSSTSEAKAEIIGARDLDMAVVEKYRYVDFIQLFEDKFAGMWMKEEMHETEKLAIIHADSLVEASFDTIRQVFHITLADWNGTRISVRMRYSKHEQYNIGHLERLYQRIQDGKREIPDFFGIVYVEDGELRMYPIEYYD